MPSSLEEAQLPQHTIEGRWPRTIDDLRKDPGRLVNYDGLKRAGIVTSRRDLRLLPPPRRLPAGDAWESRVILQAFDLQSPLAAEPASASSWRPGQPYPERADLKTVAAIITDKYGRVSHRTLERWPLIARLFNGRKSISVDHALKVASERFGRSRPRKIG